MTVEGPGMLEGDPVLFKCESAGHENKEVVESVYCSEMD